MDIQGERIVFTEPEQLIAGLPESIPRDEAGARAHAVFGLVERYAAEAEEVGASPEDATRAQVAGLFRKALFLQRLGVSLARAGAPQFIKDIEAFLRGPN